jgi:hypothetical protein
LKGIRRDDDDDYKCHVVGDRTQSSEVYRGLRNSKFGQRQKPIKSISMYCISSWLAILAKTLSPGIDYPIYGRDLVAIIVVQKNYEFVWLG